VGEALGVVTLAFVVGTTTRETTVGVPGCAVIVDLTTTGVELTTTGFDVVAGVEYTTRGCAFTTCGCV
jgi:hypothetical protein